MRILISGAGVAGPVAAYWLARAGHRVTIVERSPRGRPSIGHAVDLFTPAVRVVERMGVLDEVRDHRTGTEEMVFRRAGARRAVTIDASRLMGALSDHHVEILREDLSAILYRATAPDVEYVFDDTVAAVADDGEVAFSRGPARRFDVVIGADGLHSGVRRIVFGPEERYARWIGGYIAVAAVPAGADLGNRMTGIVGVNRMVGVYSARHLDDARAFFLFRPPAELRYDHRDAARQKQLLRAAFAGLDAEVPRLLDEVDAASGFYFDAVTQLVMDRWTRGRVALVGDAAWCPGPAVGGSTSLAVVGAYTLAAELAAAGGDTARAFGAYEEAMTPYVLRSRRFAIGMAKRLVPGSRVGVRALTTGTALFTRLPAPLRRRLVALGGDLGMHESVEIPDVPGIPVDRSARSPAANDPDRHPLDRTARPEVAHVRSVSAPARGTTSARSTPSRPASSTASSRPTAAPRAAAPAGEPTLRWQTVVLVLAASSVLAILTALLPAPANLWSPVALLVLVALGSLGWAVRGARRTPGAD